MLLVGLILLGAEAAVRIGCPNVTFMGTDRELFADLRPATRAWSPNARGVCFGVPIQIDANGCRADEERNGNPLDSAAPRWIILGDSVAFGPGVTFRETFAARLQAALPDLNVINTGVVGMDLRGYPRVLREWLDRGKSPRRVTLVYCLNDVIDVDPSRAAGDGELPFDLLHPENRHWAVEAAVGFLRSRSKLFLLAKGTLSDPGRRYFAWDLWRYEQNGDQLDAAFGPLAELRDACSAAGVEFEVVVMPYEYQLRVNSPDVWLPQQRLKQYLEREAIAFVDAADWFRDGSPASYFLFGDPMHFSPKGHSVVANRMRERAPGSRATPVDQTGWPLTNGR
jgi:lysophospholipase L1-like esterase